MEKKLHLYEKEAVARRMIMDLMNKSIMNEGIQVYDAIMTQEGLKYVHAIKKARPFAMGFHKFWIDGIEFSYGKLEDIDKGILCLVFKI